MAHQIVAAADTRAADSRVVDTRAGGTQADGIRVVGTLDVAGLAADHTLKQWAELTGPVARIRKQDSYEAAETAVGVQQARRP